ncbi:MAG: class I SAM-dependent methyltransferase [Firmicutes bacterium]|nr:class I SAM-dependent methyltransferase [Bacillota bacterium]
MADRRYDRRLGISTVGLREWRDNNTPYNRYEATPYEALDALFQRYKLTKTDKVVDFGCGRGRVAFYMHNKFHVPVTGIEAHAKTYEEALGNKPRYRQRANHINAPIRFKYGLAEHYEVKPTDNCFYFFNPFSVQIFKQVVVNILRSVEKHKRPVDIVLYYPMPEYKEFLRSRTPFQLLNKVKVPGVDDKREKFLIYRWDPLLTG